MKCSNCKEEIEEVIRTIPHAGLCEDCRNKLIDKLIIKQLNDEHDDYLEKEEEVNK